MIISGGPSSVYDADSPVVDSGIFSTGRPVLGICYGLHLMAHMLGGKVLKGEKGEYGLATLQIAQPDALFSGLDETQQIWMSSPWMANARSLMRPVKIAAGKYI